MKICSPILVLSCAVMMAGPAPAGAEDKATPFAEIHQAKAATRSKAVERIIAITDSTQTQKFRTVYGEFEAKAAALAARKVELVQMFAKENSALSDTRANEIFNQFIKLNDEEMALASTYTQRIAREVSPVAAARFSLVQEQLHAADIMERAKAWRPVESKDAPAKTVVPEKEGGSGAKTESTSPPAAREKTGAKPAARSAKDKKS